MATLSFMTQESSPLSLLAGEVEKLSFLLTLQVPERTLPVLVLLRPCLPVRP